MDKLPLDLVSRILSFLDGEGLLACSSVSTDFCALTDQRSFWENASWKVFPHLKETYDIMPYNGDWKALFRDRNRRNRSAVFEWTVTDFLSNPERRYSPIFRVENYAFKVIVDPVGNPNVYFLEPGVSVYLACSYISKEAAVEGGQAAGAADEEMDPEIDWDCCCAFSLTALNQQKRGKNVTWHSSMLNDRFHKQRKNWGVHSLLPISKLKDSSLGFVVDDTLRLKVRLRLLYLTVKVVRTQSLKAHEGFGIADTTQSEVLSYEMFHCTTLNKFKEILMKDLGLRSSQHVRLWVFTQPWPDTVLCPREILLNEPLAPPDSHEDDLNSPTLFSLLQMHMDGLGVARIWAECNTDGGYYGESGGAAGQVPRLIPGDENMSLSYVPVAPDPRDLSSQALHASEDSHVLLFLKYVDPHNLRMFYITHIVARLSTPVSAIFDLVSGIVLQQSTSLVGHIETTPANWQPAANTLHRLLSLPAQTNQSLRDVGIENGQIITFSASVHYMKLENIYRGYLDNLFRGAYVVYYGEPANSAKLMARRNRTLKLEEVVNLFERLGYQSFRVRNVYYQHKHQNARQTLEYVIQGRHLGFCCDRCGATDFTGPRYKCMKCYDYDLCAQCQGFPDAAAHRYRYEHRGWKRENHFNEHVKDHQMHMVLPVPYKLHLLHR